MRFSLLLFACACTGRVIMTPSPVEPAAPTRIEGALADGPPAAVSAITSTDALKQLALVGGALAVAGAETTWRLELGALVALSVGGEGEPSTTGPVRHLARRGDGLFVVAEGGLFHDSNGRLLRSPLSDVVPPVGIRALDDLGSGPDEELWLTTEAGVDRARAMVLTRVDLDFERVTAQPDFAIGFARDVAVLVASGQLISVDLAAQTATWQAKDLPQVNAVARGDDGTVYLATERGLYARGRDATVKLYTFAAAGEDALPVKDVFSAYGETLVAVGGSVALLDTVSAKKLGALAAPRARGIARDANGDTFVLDGATLKKLATGRPISFATDVQPFLTTHCSVCHATGAHYTPVIIDFTDLGVVKAKAPAIVKRLTAVAGPATVMPPSSFEVITSNDYAVFLRWVAGGEQP